MLLFIGQLVSIRLLFKNAETVDMSNALHSMYGYL